MSEVNWGAFAPTNDPRTYAAIGQARAESRRLQQEQDLNDRKFAAQREQAIREQTAYQRAAQLYAAGDYDGAKAAVLGMGNHELLNAANSSSTQSFDQHRQGLQVVGSYAKWIAENVPDLETRKTMIAANRQMFINAGADEDDIDAVAADPSDAVLGGVAHMYYAPEKQDEARQKAYDGETDRITATNPVVVGGSLITRGGEELYRAPEYINAPSGSNVYEVGGTSSSGYIQDNLSSDAVFAGMIQAESGGQQFAKNGQPLTSAAGAVGIAQVMPGTAPEAARLAGVPWDENRYRNDPKYNEALGRAYFQSMVQRYGGDHEKAVAAYNAGPGRVDQAVARGGANWRSDLPAETRGYVSKVLGRRDTSRSTRQIQTAETKPGASEMSKPLSEKDIAGARTKLGQVRRLKAQVVQLQELDPEGGRLSGASPSGKRGGIYGGMVGGLVPGNTPLIGAGDSDRYDTLVANVRNTITALTRVPGIGSQSDYEARLAAATMPERTRSPEGRAEAYQQVWQIAVEMEKELTIQSEGRLGGGEQPRKQQAPARTQPKIGQRAKSPSGVMVEWTGSSWRRV